MTTNNNESINIINTNKSMPAISFYTIVDIDFGMVNYVLSNFRNKSVFDIDRFESMEIIDLVKEVYYRKNKNPLVSFAADLSKIQFIDKLYEEFTEKNEDEILINSITTEMVRLIKEFKNSGDIIPTIFYYTESQKIVLESMKNELGEVYIKSFRTVFNDPDSYTQFFLKDINEVSNIKDLSEFNNKTFYFSTCALNLNEDNDDIASDEIIDDILHNFNHISLIDIYRTDVIGKVKDDD